MKVQVFQYESSTQDWTFDYNAGKTNWTLEEMKDQLTTAKNGEYAVYVFNDDDVHCENAIAVIETDVDPMGLVSELA